MSILKSVAFRMIDLDFSRHFFARAISRTHEAVVTRKRTLRISQEIASLSTDLPIEWASSIFIRADEVAYSITVQLPLITALRYCEDYFHILF